MDEGPFRASRPADRRVVSRPEPVQRPQEGSQPVRAEAQPVERAPLDSRDTRGEKSSRRFKLPLIIAAIIILGLIGWFVWSGMNNKNGATAIDTSKYQAVFFTNGQVYFGKLSPLSDEYMKLTDIFYLQTPANSDTEANPQKTSSDQSNVQLIKLGSEIHGPEDQMVISKDQVLFYENIKNDGKVAQSIATYKKSH